jgi:bifunctional DNA-binding transcriptional regulator/antitoxin component of YhaV-PrlF toxin-antitoxin module
MGNDKKLLGSTKVSTDNKVTIVKNAAELLGVNKGDILAFYEEKGRVYIEKG